MDEKPRIVAYKLSMDMSWRVAGLIRPNPWAAWKWPKGMLQAKVPAANVIVASLRGGTSGGPPGKVKKTARIKKFQAKLQA
jgi:hypothetical protein